MNPFYCVDGWIASYKHRILPLAAIMLAASLFVPDAFFATAGLVLSLTTIFFFAMRRLCKGWGRAQFFSATLLVALVLKVLLLLMANTTLLFPDEVTQYDPGAWQMAQEWRGGNYFTRQHPAQLYYLIIAGIYSVVGHIPLIPKLINVFVSVLLAVVLSRTAQAVFSKSAARIVWLATLLFPSLILWYSTMLRDGFIIFFALLALCCAVRFIQRPGYALLFGALSAAFVTTLLRNYVGIFIFVAVFLAVIIAARRVSPMFIAGMIILVLLSTPFVTEVIKGRYHNLSLKSLQHRRSLSLAIGRTAFAKDADISSLPGLLQHIPVGAAYFLFAPFPGDTSSALTALAGMNSFLLYLFMLFGLFGLSRMNPEQWNAFMPMLAFAVLLTLFSAVIEGNVGTAMRHRAQIVPLILLLGAYGLAQTRCLRRVFA